ncbi:hypothetical protein KJ633_09210 [bacterium]|nr:hypothetical protein [bacterium]MBU4133814.1 hypothetical protein [bacterium]
MWKRLMQEDAQGMTEYILIIALIAVACVVALKLFGGSINKLITVSTRRIQDQVSD